MHTYVYNTLLTCFWYLFMHCVAFGELVCLQRNWLSESSLTVD